MKIHFDPPEKYKLSDLTIATVGLVRRAAVGEDGKNFILFKANTKEDNPMADKEKEVRDVTVEQVDHTPEDTVAPGFWDRLANLVKREVENAAPQPPAEEEEPQVDVVKALEASQLAHLEAIKKAHQEQLAAVQKALAEKYEGQIADLTQRIEKAEQDTAAADEQRQQREWVEKAMQFKAFPTTYADLGSHLYRLHKALDADEMDWWLKVLKAADRQLFTAGLFNEMGTSKGPDEIRLEGRVLKAQADGDPAEALLTLPPEEQQRLLDARREVK